MIRFFAENVQEPWQQLITMRITTAMIVLNTKNVSPWRRLLPAMTRPLRGGYGPITLSRSILGEVTTEPGVIAPACWSRNTPSPPAGMVSRSADHYLHTPAPCLARPKTVISTVCAVPLSKQFAVFPTRKRCEIFLNTACSTPHAWYGDERVVYTRK